MNPDRPATGSPVSRDKPVSRKNTPPERKPSFLIIGAQRSASTFLNTCMRRHPDVFLPNGEIEHFEDPAYGTHGPRFFTDLFSSAPGAKVYGYKRPELLARPECPERIAADLPAVRLIAVLREPIARTISAYYHYVNARLIPPLPLDDGLNAILDGNLSVPFPMAEQVVTYSLYGEQIARYRHFFSDDALLVLFDERLTRRTKDVLTATFQFVGVDPERASPPPGRRTNPGVYSGPRLRFIRMVSPLAYAYDPGSQFLRVRENRIALAAYKSAVRFDRAVLAPLVGNDRPSLGEGVRARLDERFRPDLAVLRSLIGPLPDSWAAA